MSPIHLARRTLLQAGIATGGLAAVARPARAAPSVIRYATGGGIGPNEMETVIYLDWMKQNVLQHYGRDYTLEMTYTRGSPEAATLLAAGQADMGMLAFSTFATTVVKDAVPGGLTIVSDGYEDGRPGFASNTFFVRKDSSVQTVQDLKGRRVGINAFGSAVDLDLRVYLKSHGLDPKRDVQVVEIAFGNMAAAIREKRIECGVLVLPFMASEAAKGDLRPLFTGGDALGPHAVTLKVARNDFLKDNAAAVRGFLADYITGLTWFYQPANRAKAIELVAGFTKQPPEALDSFFLTPRDYYRDPNGCLTVQAVQAPIDAMRREDLLSAPVDVSRFINLSYLPNPCP